jgi:hypothetical protein
VRSPGGPVRLLGDAPLDSFSDALAAAEAKGAVLAIVQREGEPGKVQDEPKLERLGFHNPSEFYQGIPRA